MSLLGGVIGSIGSALSGVIGGLGSDSGSSAADDAGIISATQGSNPPPPEDMAPKKVSGSQAGNLVQDSLRDGLRSLVSGGVNKGVNTLLGNDASGQGKAARDYLAAAFPELTPWERAGAGGTMSGSADAGFKQQEELQKNQLENEVKLKQMDNETSLAIAGIQTQAQIRNTDANLAPILERLPYEIARFNSEISRINASTDLTNEQKRHEVEKIENTKAELLRIKYGNSDIGRLLLDSTNAGFDVAGFIHKSGLLDNVPASIGGILGTTLGAPDKARKSGVYKFNHPGTDGSYLGRLINK